MAAAKHAPGGGKRFKFADKKKETKKKAETTLNNSNWLKISKLLKIPLSLTPKNKRERLPPSETLQRSETQKKVDKSSVLVTGDYQGLTKHMAIDCEMVGVSKYNEKSALARCAIVNYFGQVVYDEFIIPEEPIYHYRTEFSGVTKEILDDRGVPYKKALKDIYKLISSYKHAGEKKEIILIGHDINFDLKMLFHPKNKQYVRDTASYAKIADDYYEKLQITERPDRTVSLKKYAKTLLNISIQESEHSAVEDAQAAMALFRLYEDGWDRNSGKKKSRRGGFPVQAAGGASAEPAATIEDQIDEIY